MEEEKKDALPKAEEKPAAAGSGFRFSWKMGLAGVGIGLGLTVVIGLIIVTVGLYKFGWDGPGAQLAGKVLPYPAATVNGTPIKLAEFQKDVDTLERFYTKAEAYGLAPAGAGSPDEAEIRSSALDRLIRNVLLAEEAEKFSLSVTDGELDAEFARLSGSEGAEDITTQISDLYGWDIPTFKQKVLYPYLMEQKLATAVSDDESFVGEAKAKAESALAELNNGADFEVLAAKYSDDPGSAEAGGELGWFERGQMVQEFEDLAFSLEPGVVGGPVKTRFGYHLILVDETEEGDDGEVAKVSAKHILFATPTFEEYMADRMEEAKIKRYVDVPAAGTDAPIIE